MTWVRLEDTFCEHPKVEPLTDLAFRLHVKALCYANRNLTDGYVPSVAARAMGGSRHKSACRELVTAGVWELARGGFRIHDYLDFQFSRGEVVAIRQLQKAGGKARAAKAERVRGRFAPAPHQQGPGASLDQQSTSRSTSDPPAHPVPMSLLKEETGTPEKVRALLKGTHLGRLA
jgi:hypothetical protein